MPLQALLMTPQHHVGDLGWLHPAGPTAGIGGVSGQMGVWSVFLRINYKDDWLKFEINWNMLSLWNYNSFKVWQLSEGHPNMKSQLTRAQSPCGHLITSLPAPRVSASLPWVSGWCLSLVLHQNGAARWTKAVINLKTSQTLGLKEITPSAWPQTGSTFWRSG